MNKPFVIDEGLRGSVTWVWEKQQTTNGQLEAAAPELLEALTNLCGLAEKRPGSLFEYKAAVDSARAAISKATGCAA
jgi:hypothetical protein